MKTTEQELIEKLIVELVASTGGGKHFISFPFVIEVTENGVNVHQSEDLRKKTMDFLFELIQKHGDPQYDNEKYRKDVDNLPNLVINK